MQTMALPLHHAFPQTPTPPFQPLLVTSKIRHLNCQPPHFHKISAAAGFSEEPKSNSRANTTRRDQNIAQILVKRLARNLSDRHLLQAGERILVAVSGGQDSICLLWMLSQLQQRWEWKVGVVHCDHQWNPQSSAAQASHVAQVARGLGHDYYQSLPTMDAFGETRARAWRYGVLHRIALRHAYDVVITAHTASDRVETLLHNLFRGTGLQGLQSLTWTKEFGAQIPFHKPYKQVRLVRPLLDTTRTELRQLCETLQLPLWPDPSNFSLEINRNRIRHELLPYLRENFASGIDRNLARWAEILHGEESFLRSLTENIRSKAEKSMGHGVMKLDVSIVESLPLALQRRVLKQFIELHTGKSACFDTIERLRLAYGQTSYGNNSARVSLRGGFEVHLQEKTMLLLRKGVSNAQ